MGNTAGEGICEPAPSGFLLPLEPEMKKKTWNKENQNEENHEDHENQENQGNHENHKNQKYTITVTKN